MNWSTKWSTRSSKGQPVVRAGICGDVCDVGRASAQEADYLLDGSCLLCSLFSKVKAQNPIDISLSPYGWDMSRHKRN